MAHLDDVVDAVRDWAHERADKVGEARTIASRRAKFLPPVPQPRSFRDYHTFEAHAKAAPAKRAAR